MYDFEESIAQKNVERTNERVQILAKKRWFRASNG